MKGHKRRPQKFCLSLLIWMSVVGQTGIFGQPGMTLEGVLEKLEKHGSKVKSMSAKMEQRKWTEILEEFDEGERGRFLFLKKDGEVFLRKEITEPQPSSLVIARGEALFYQPVIKQAQKYRLGKNKDKAEFLLLGFGASRESLEQAYQLELQGSEEVNGRSTWILGMTPKSDQVQAYFEKIELWIDSQLWVPIQQKLTEPTGDFLLVRFWDLDLNPRLDPSAFKLKLPKETKVLTLN